jgi:hypothetical protein
VRRRRLDGGPSRRGEVSRWRWCSGGRSVGSPRKSGQEASSSRCSAGGELGEDQEETERRDDGEAEQRRWTERPARRSSDVRVREWRTTGQGASVGGGGAARALG